MKNYYNKQSKIKWSNIVSLIFALFILVPFFAQAQRNDDQLSIELNGSAGFFQNSSTIFIPQIGFDYYSGLLGIRVNGQFFKNSTAFNFDNYLKPLQPIFTTEVKKESNTNIVLGLTPYLNFNSEFIGIQPGISFQYLIQNSASAQAYYQNQENTVLKFPDESKTQKVFLITPNVKLFVNVFKGFTFFLQTGYVIPKGQNEISYTMRDYKTNNAGIDVKTVMNTPLTTKTEKILPEHFNIGIGFNISLWSTPKKALDAFIPATTKAVAGAEITRVIAIIVRAVGGESGPAEKTQFDVILRSKIKTNNLGEFSIVIPPQQLERLPDTFSLKMMIIPPKGWTGISSSNEATVKVNKSDGPKFEFVLSWQTEGIKSNKGSFAVNAKSQN